MKKMMLLLTLTLIGCAKAQPKVEDVTNPTTPARDGLIRTSRVHPDDLGWDAKVDLGYTGEKGEQICRTKLREYCVTDGDCDWYVDFYVLKAPQTCPVEPVE